MDDKLYTPEVIQENPFPGEIVQPILSSPQAVGVGNFTPTQTKEKTFPKKRTAIELLSTALNTKTRKILQEFKLEQSGGIQIGNFQEGISGDMRLTPNGQTARNIAGLTTFAIDGDTGDVFLLGTIRAGSIISESTIEGGSININDVFIVDEDGNLTATSATFGQYLSKAGTNQVLAGSVLVGNGAGGSSVLIDGANNRILINDGTNNRIVIGNV